MTLISKNVLRYWRASLADGALGRGQFKQRDREKFISLSKSTLQDGSLFSSVVEKAFRNQRDDSEPLSVRIWPLVAARKTSHVVSVSGRFPEIVAPVVTEAMLARNGVITPIRSAIARDVLSPLPNGEFSIGTVDALDAFLTGTPLLLKGGHDAWPQYLVHCRKMVDEVTDGWPSGDENYIPIGTGFLELTDNAAATVRHVLELYDILLEETPDTPLLSQCIDPTSSKAETAQKIDDQFARRLGHSNDRFPLTDHQRQVLPHLSAARSAEVLAVNGPPGTGKTTLLLSAIADAWVGANINISQLNKQKAEVGYVKRGESNKSEIHKGQDL